MSLDAGDCSGVSFGYAHTGDGMIYYSPEDESRRRDQAFPSVSRLRLQSRGGDDAVISP